MNEKHEYVGHHLQDHSTFMHYEKPASYTAEVATESSSGRQNGILSIGEINVDAPQKQFFFDHRGKCLMRAITLTGSVGFFLFGYDQGVLGVSVQALPSLCQSVV